MIYHKLFIEGLQPDGVVMDFQVFGGSCKDEVEMEKLKKAFVAAMKRDILINNLFCATSTKHCTLENIVIRCDTHASLFYAGSTRLSIKFSLAMRENVASKVPKDVLKKLSGLADFLNQLKGSLQSKVKY